MTNGTKTVVFVIYITTNLDPKGIN